MKLRKRYIESYQRYKQRPNWIFQGRVKLRLKNIKTGEIIDSWAYSKGFKRFDKKAIFQDALEHVNQESWEIEKIYTAVYDVIKEVKG